MRPPQPLRDFRRPVKGLTKVQDCLLGAGGSPDLRPDVAPGNAQQLNGTSAPRPDSPGAPLSKRLSKADSEDTQLSKR